MPKSMLLTTSKRVQHKIVAAHNLFRSNVRPKASNMLEMVSCVIYSLLDTFIKSHVFPFGLSLSLNALNLTCYDIPKLEQEQISLSSFRICTVYFSIYFFLPCPAYVWLVYNFEQSEKCKRTYIGKLKLMMHFPFNIRFEYPFLYFK